MKNENVTRFKIKFPKSIFWICAAIYALCGVGIGLSIWRWTRFGISEPIDILKYPFLILICLFCVVVVTSVLIQSEYIVTDQFLISKFGLVKSKFSIKEITALVLDSDSKKLTVSFGEQFIVLSVSPEWNEDLSRELLKVNPDIDYSFTFSDPEKPKK